MARYPLPSLAYLFALATLISAVPLQRRGDIVFGANGLPAVQVAPSSTPATSPTPTSTMPISASVSVSVSVSTVEETSTIVYTKTAPARTVTVVVMTTMAPGATPAPTGTWTAPNQYNSPQEGFGFKDWTWGSSFASIVTELPTTAYAPTATPRWGSAMAIRYPAGSANPAAEPQGGFGFYSSPIDLSKASNVSLSYSVFFPADFDFVKGGKLPGLYGGHGGCSGGKEAEDCFSTRVMWREAGAGELYLYAPKGKQPESLCSLPPTTYCDTSFGASIGRGSFSFARGEWTDVRQDIWLNTPGQADGGFNLWLNGKLALSSSTVYFRHDVDAASEDAGSIATPSSANANEPAGILDGLGLGDLLPIRRRSFINIGPAVTTTTTLPASTVTTTSTSTAILAVDATLPFSAHSASPSDVAAGALLDDGLLGGLFGGLLGPRPAAPAPAASPVSASDTSRVLAATKETVGFRGVMGETFFGGKAKDGFATPRDQTAYFGWMKLAIEA